MKKLSLTYALLVVTLTSCSLWSENPHEQQPSHQPTQPAEEQTRQPQVKAITVPTGQVVLLESITRSGLDATTAFTTILGSYDTVVVDFFTTWCGPCKTMSHVLESTAPAYPNVVFLKVNTESFPALAKTYSIRSIPTLIFFKNGKKMAQTHGLSAAQLKEKIKGTLGV